jgi:hypothetical protein
MQAKEKEKSKLVRRLIAEKCLSVQLFLWVRQNTRTAAAAAAVKLNNIFRRDTYPSQ